MNRNSGDRSVPHAGNCLTPHLAMYVVSEPTMITKRTTAAPYAIATKEYQR
jgi:hypothetical protein